MAKTEDFEVQTRHSRTSKLHDILKTPEIIQPEPSKVDPEHEKIVSQEAQKSRGP